MALSVLQSYGDVLDRITILELKVSRIADPAKVDLARTEMSALVSAWSDAGLVCWPPQKAQLSSVNTQLWEVEDRLREREAAGDFGAGFLTDARSVYKLNDQRAALKREVNRALGSGIEEVKSYKG